MTLQPRAGRGAKGERRIVSVLFCDVAGSTLMAERLDPEDWAEIMDAAFEVMIAPVYRYGGTVARLMGDGILAFFGAPLAHEDDPIRSVLAGLDIVAETKKFASSVEREYGLAFEVRVGINTGLVVVADVGSELAGEYTAMGDAINLAARMEQTAAPGTVQITADTYKMVSGRFDVETLGSVEVKGRSAAIPTYRVLAQKKRPGRQRGLQELESPLIGRDGELASLKTALSQLGGKQGRIVTLVGEAGLGKSRLIEELRTAWLHTIGSGTGAWQGSAAQSYESERPYGLFLHRLRHIFNIQEDDSSDTIRTKIAHVIQDPTDSQDMVHDITDITLHMLAATAEDTPSPLQREGFTDELHQVMGRVWRKLAARDPLIMVFEDFHWTDRASVELLENNLGLVEEAPVLFLFSMRPDKQSPGWRLKELVTARFPNRSSEITLAPLSEQDSDTLVSELFTASQLPTELRRSILNKAEGNPLFVEEVARALIDSGALARGENGARWEVVTKEADIVIPDNLQALLTSRIDQLEPETRSTLQRAAVIGRSFSEPILKSISDANEPLERQLESLKRHDFIREAAQTPDRTYSFHHQLTRDAAYASILRRQRRIFHRLVGEAIEAHFDRRTTQEAHRLALHFAEADEHIKAKHYFIQAGDEAARLYAHEEAAAYYRRALELCGQTETTSAELIHVYTKLGRTLELSRDYEAVVSTYRQLNDLATQRNDDSLRLTALVLEAILRSKPNPCFDVSRAERLARDGLELARDRDDRAMEAKALWVLMMATPKNPDQATAYGEASAAIARELNLKEQLAYSLSDLTGSYYLVGRTEQALKANREALELWRELGDLPALANSLTSGGVGAFFSGDFDRASELCHEALSISESIHNAWGQAYSRTILSMILLERGELMEAIESMHEALQLSEQGRLIAIQVTVSFHLALAYASIGNTERACTVAKRGRQKTEEIWDDMQPSVMGALARIYLLTGDPERARETLEAAPRELDASNAVGFLSPHGLLATVELALLRQEYAKGLRVVDEGLAFIDRFGLRPFYPELLSAKSNILLAQGEQDQAYRLLEQTRSEAESMGAKRILWQVLVTLARLEEERQNFERADRLRREALTIVERIAATLKERGLEASFLRLPQVQTLVAWGETET